MADVNKLDSNSTTSHFIEEAGEKILPTSDKQWYEIEPNEYGDFGGQVTTIARNPINASRQRKKGLAVDLDASVGFTTDLTQDNMPRLLRGFLFADFREKPDTQAFSAEKTFNSDGSDNAAEDFIVITNVDGTNNDYENTGDDFTAAPGGFRAGDLILAQDFGVAANNGLKVVGTPAATSLPVTTSLTDEASPPAAARLIMVGHQFGAGDLDVDASSGFAKLTTTTKDLTQLGLTPGEWIYIGGDTASLAFSNAANNGFKRVRSIAANEIVIDKSESDMVTEASSTETVQVFVGRVLKNESSSSNIKTRTFQFERQYPGNDDADLTLEQAEYVEGCYANELTINVPSADKVTMELTFAGLNSATIDENISGANSLRTKLGSSTKNAPEEADPFNTSSDVPRIALTKVVDGDEGGNDLLAFLEEFTITINNNASANKAVGVFGSCGVTIGQFVVDMTATGYFSDVAAIQSVRDTDDVSFDFHLVKSNAGISFDLPLLTLGDGRPNVSQDEAVRIPLSNAAATGRKVSTSLDHTFLMVFFDYLPTAAG